MLRFLTAGESHGPCLTAIVEGLPSGLAIDVKAINRDLARRQGGYGRGGRMKIEKDKVEVLSGVIASQTTGAPVSVRIENRDWANWRDRWAAGDLSKLTVPRPGHADYAGMVKYGLDDARPVLERASARETAARVAVGVLTKLLLAAFGITVGSYVVGIGGATATVPDLPPEELWALAEASDVRCPNEEAAERMRAAIDAARKAGDSLGGVFVVTATGVPVGLGSHVHWDRRLDARLAAAVMSIQAIKGVEIGPAFENARQPGTRVHDELYPDGVGSVTRRTNRAGGIEGGMSNGAPVVVRAAMKPIPTTITPLQSVDLATGKAAETQYQRSDVCAVPAASIVGEAMVAWVLADALLAKFGGDSLAEIRERVG
ncbi:MAG: chorismate synthase [Chloroflexi bacterium]|nr:chorismate synthase [Chloroflexota bacterium]